MSDRTLKTVFGVLGLLIIAYAVAALASRGVDDRGAVDASLARIAAIAPAEVEAIAFDGAGDSVGLRRDDSGWTVDGHRADSATVARFLGALEALADAELAATNAANHGRLGVAPDVARDVRIELAAGETARLLVGYAGPRAGSVYVRPPDADEVYLVRADLRGYSRREVADWRDRTMVRLDTAAVHEIRIGLADGGGYTLRRGDDGWSVDGGPADERTVGEVLGALAALRAAGFAAPGTAVEPARTLAASDAAGQELVRIRMDEPDERSRVRAVVSGDETVYELSRWEADRLAPADTPAAEPPAASDEAGP